MTRKGKFDEPYGTLRRLKLQARHARKKAARVNNATSQHPLTAKEHDKRKAKRKAAEASRKHNRRYS